MLSNDEQKKKFVRWNDCDLQVKFLKYEADNTIAMQMMYLDKDKEWTFYCMATVCVPHSGIDAAKEVLIKDYSENQGILDALVAAGVVSKPKRSVPLSSNFPVKAQVCDLLWKSDEQ